MSEFAMEGLELKQGAAVSGRRIWRAMNFLVSTLLKRPVQERALSPTRRLRHVLMSDMAL